MRPQFICLIALASLSSAASLKFDTASPPLPAGFEGFEKNRLAVQAARDLTAVAAYGRRLGGCGWWDPLGACKAMQGSVQKLLDAIPGMTEELKEAVMQVVDQLFDKISKTLEQAEAAFLRIEKQLAEDAQKLLAQVEAAIKSVTDHIVSKVEQLISLTVAEITAACEAIIKDVSNLVDRIFSHITGTLHQFEGFAWKALCTGEGMIKQIELFLSASSMVQSQDACECVHDAAVWAQDSCADTCTCKKGWIQPYKCSCQVQGWAALEDQNLFHAIRCKAEKEVNRGIANNKTAHWVAAKLGSIADLAYQLQCYHFNAAGTIGNWYAEQALDLTRAINIWMPPQREHISSRADNISLAVN